MASHDLGSISHQPLSHLTAVESYIHTADNVELAFSRCP